MKNSQANTRLKIFFSLLLIAAVFLHPNVVRSEEFSLTPTTIIISQNEIEQVEVAYNPSTIEPERDNYSLKVVGSSLTDGTKTISLSSLEPVLQSLHTLYPGTRPVLVHRWTDDYPYAKVGIALKDGRYLLISSRSQYGRLVPWNIQIWQGKPEENGVLQNAYILLHDDFYASLSSFWDSLTGSAFPRDYGPERFWEHQEKTDTIDFYVPERYKSFSSGALKAQITGASWGVIEPYLPYLQQNPVTAKLLENGYTIYDLAFDMTVTVEQMRPISYSGTIAFVTPDARDVIITTIQIQLEPEIVVKTPLTETEVNERIKERQSFTFLQKMSQLFPDITYLSDTRQSIEPLDVDCPENDDTKHASFSIQALLTGHNNLPIYFHYFNKPEAWSIDMYLDRENGYWDDTLASVVLANWFPAEFSSLEPTDLNQLATNFAIAFRSDVSDAKRELIADFKLHLPSEAAIHYKHPQKVGDMSFIRLEGRVIVQNNAEPPQVIYCGHTRPDWYGPPYQTELVEIPQDVDRSDIRKATAEGEWRYQRSLRDESSEAARTTLEISKPGFVHLLWTTDEGVYYADGWADGAEWIEEQRLGDGSWNIDIAANTNGVVHLLWSVFDPSGSMHVWKNAQGQWQKPEYWPGIGYFSQTILDQEGVLHLGYRASDGQDDEFFYQNWTEQKGLSEPENVSRRLGDSGDGILRIDTQNAVHAAWMHPLNSSQYINTFGQVFDQVGIFYSHRLGLSNWTLPEQIGTFAYFAYSMDFILNNQDEPVIAWQSDDGIVISMRHNEHWIKPYLLAKAISPKTPVGSDSFGEVTAEIRLGKDEESNIYAAWFTTLNGLYLSKYDGINWSTPQQISEPASISSLNMVVTPDGIVHLLYFKDDDPESYLTGSSLFYVSISEDRVQTTKIGSGSRRSRLILDEAGYIYALASSRPPSWYVYIPSGGIRPTATATSTPVTTPTPIAVTPTPTSTYLPTTISPTFTGTPKLITSSTPVPSSNAETETANRTIWPVLLLSVGAAAFLSIIVFIKRRNN